MRTVVLIALALPVINTFAMHTKIPVLMPARVAATADDMRFVKVDRLIQQRPQVISVLEVMAGQAPDVPLSVFELKKVKNLQWSNLGIWFHRCMALVTRIKR